MYISPGPPYYSMKTFTPVADILSVSVWLSAFSALFTASMIEAHFLILPENVNATLNSTVTFKCQAIGFAQLALSICNNNTNVQISPALLVQNENMSELVVIASEDRNKSMVKCCGYIIREENQLKQICADSNFTLLVQGLLSSVTNLTAISNSTSITLTWVPPFSLDITGVEPDFTHTVEVYMYNLMTLHTHSIHPMTQKQTYEDITDSYFIFTLCEANDTTDMSDSMINQSGESSGNGVVSGTMECMNLNFNTSSVTFGFVVTAVNDVGEGAPSSINASFSAEKLVMTSYTPVMPSTLSNTAANTPTTTTTLHEVQFPMTTSSLILEVPADRTTSLTLGVSGSLIAIIIFVIAIAIILVTLFLIRKRKQEQFQMPSGCAPPQMNYYEEHLAKDLQTTVQAGSLYVNVSRTDSTEQAGVVTYMTTQELNICKSSNNATKQQEVVDPTLVVYSEIPKHLDPSLNLIYEHVDLKPASRGQAPIDDPTRVIYSDIQVVHMATESAHVTTQHQPSLSTLEESTQTSNEDDKASPPSTNVSLQPFTKENLLTALNPLAHKWRELGLQLEHGIDEDRIDEFDTNNETDEACLEDMMDYYFKNVHFEHSWKEIGASLRQIGEEDLAQKIVK